MHDHDDDLDRGLAFDLGTIVSRRTVLSVAVGAGAAVLFAARGDDDASSATTSPTTPSTTAGSTSPSTTGGAPGSGPPPGGSFPGGPPGGPGGDAGGTTTTNPDTGLSAVPEETAGPFPGDGSNGVDVLSQSGIVRSDIRASFGSASGTSGGVPMTLQMTVVDVATKQPLAGAAVYVWHCDNEGNYSLYSRAAAKENYLRGVQVTGTDGLVTFTSNYPACYSGRWPHVHYEVYPGVDSITDAGNKIATSQIALPDDVNAAVYALDSYPGSTANYRGMTLANDNVFSDGTAGEEPTVTGDVDAGYTVSITSPVSTS